MTRTRGISGVVVLCALAVFAFAAPSAFAVKGTTAFTCAKVETGAQFSDAHCTKAGTGTGYKHVAIALVEKTNITLTNQNTQNETKEATPAVIKFHLGSMDGELRCSSVKGEGTLTNGESGGVMNVNGTASVTFSECTVLPTVTFPECQLESPFTVNTSFSSPTEEMNLKFSPPVEVLVKFRLHKCKSPFENAEYLITGSYTAAPTGSTWETTTESSDMSATGARAGLISKLTVTRTGTETGIATTTN